MKKKDFSIVGREFMDHFDVGDIVRFCGDSFDDCVEIKTGIILDIFSISLIDGNFNFPHAKVYVMGYDASELVMLANLTLLYKVSD